MTEKLYIEDVKTKWNNKEYETQLEYPSTRKFRDEHVFDEEKSVKWNREEVQRQNDLIKQKLDAYRADQNRLHQQLTKDCVNAVMYEGNVSEKRATLIVDYVYREKHSSMHDYFIYLEEMTELVRDILNAEE